MKNIFLCGHRKSGTTMLSNLLDGHPELCVYPSDICLLYGYYPYHIQNDREANRLRIEKVVFDTLRRKARTTGYTDRFNPELLKKHFDKNIDMDRLDDMSHVLSTLFTSYQNIMSDRNISKKHFVAKETSIEIYADTLDQWFPGCRFIQLIRDPRDNYGAIKAGNTKHYRIFGETEKHSLASLLHRGALGMRLAHINTHLLGTERYMVLRFEDLVTEPKTSLQKICAFLNIDFHESLLTPTVLQMPTQGNNYDGKKLFRISRDNVGRWRERISNEEAQIIEFHFKDLMTAFGYTPEYPTTEAAAAAREFYKWTNYQYFFKDSFSHQSEL